MALRHRFGIAIVLMLLASLTTGDYGCDKKEPPGSPDEGLIRLVADHHQAVDFEGAGAAESLAPFRDLARSHEVFVLSGDYRIANNFNIALSLLMELHTLGYRYLMIHDDFISAHAYNSYLTSGDETLIAQLMSRHPCEMNSADYLQFWRDVRTWNEELPADQRISVWAYEEYGVWRPTSDDLRIIGELIGSLPDSATAARLQAAWSKVTTSYWDVKPFEVMAREALAGQSSPAATRLLATVRQLKDACAIAQSANTGIARDDYPGIVSIGQQARRASFEYYWQSRPAESPGKVFAFMHSVLDLSSVWGGNCYHTTYADLLAGQVADIQCMPVVDTERRHAVCWPGHDPLQQAVDNEATAAAIATQTEHQYMFIPYCREGDGHLFIRTVTPVVEIK